MSYTENFDGSESIAIVGLSGRFPGARTIDAFWQNLCNGLETISRFSDEELKAAGNDDPALLNHPNFVKAKGVIENAEWFDASFFGFNPREAQTIDPQHRVFLECAWEALEHAGYDPAAYPGAIGVYAGASMNTYLINNIVRNIDFLNTVGTYQTMLGNDKDFLPTRVSYKLNLTGPSVNIQTACSTSLVAVQLAVQSLLDYQCDMALAGGASISSPQKTGYLYQEGMILSPDGHCRAFDAQAGGTVLGEGVGVVVLKRLPDAIADGDYIWAVIKGAAINNDGALKVGYTAPSVDGQAAAIIMAQTMAEVDPETISYIEAHGTGTVLGDPIEIAALTEVFRSKTGKKNFCAIGSVKTNIGHLDAAAGMAGLIKTSLALKHEKLPPSLHFKSPNPKIDFAGSPFYVNTELKPWRTNGHPRRAGVSSFGIGGTNAHVVLEEAPGRKPNSAARRQQLLLLSAKTPTALDAATQNLAAHLKSNPDLDLADAAYTLQVGRRAFEQRRVLVCSDVREAIETLESMNPQSLITAATPENTPDVVFMFTGQGAQYVNMARELYQTESTFRQQVDDCAEFLRPKLGLDLREILYPLSGYEEEATQKLRQTALAQPALFVIEYSLAKLWQSWGVQPQAMIGHSLGEYVAACLAGVFSLEDGLTLVAERGRLMQSMLPGAMLSVQLPETQLIPYLKDGIALAAVNGPSLCVVSGPTEAVAALQRQFEGQGVHCQPLHTSHAFHSPMMEPALEPFTRALKSIRFQAPQMPFISNVTGNWITAAQAVDPAYWANHLRQPVRFAAGIETLLKDANRIFVEVGPGQTLSTLVSQQPGQSTALTSLRHPRQQVSDVAFMLKTLGQLWMAGLTIDWKGFHGDEQRYRLPLPTYPFERQRYWVEPQAMEASVNQDLLARKQNLADWIYVPSWNRSPLPAAHIDSMNDKKSWLIFANEDRLSANILCALRESGQSIVTVKSGTAYKHINEETYILDPRQSADYQVLLATLRESNRMPDIVIHLWSAREQTVLDFESVATSLYLGYNSLTFLARAWSATGMNQSLKLLVVSSNLHEVTGEEILQPDKATLLGAIRTIPQEYPQIRARSIDIVLPPTGSRQEGRLVENLVNEALLDDEDLVVAYRGTHRWVQTFAPTRLDPAKKTPSLLRERGVYLITNGIDGSSQELAEYLARTIQARLVLNTQTPLPPRNEWEAWLSAQNGSDAVSHTIQQIYHLEDLGAEVLTVHADIADSDQMQSVVEQAQQKFATIHGVIHAANEGENSNVALSHTVTGTLVLDAIFKDKPLDFMVLCSSIDSILSRAGQDDESAASAFIDSFAHYAQANSEAPVISINWESGLTSEETRELFERILSNPAPEFLISTRDLAHRVRLHKAVDETAQQESDTAGANGKSANGYSSRQAATQLAPRPKLPTEYVAPQSELEQKVAEIWKDLLGLAEVGIHDNFFELGGHSLLATQILSRLREEFNVDLPLRSLFEAMTVAELSERLEAILWAARNKEAAAEFAIEERDEIEL